MAEEAKPAKAETDSSPIVATESETIRSLGGVGNIMKVVGKTLLVILALILIRSCAHSVFPERSRSGSPGTSSYVGQPVAEPTITLEKVERTQVPVTTEFGDDLYANLKLGERIGFDPIGARMVFYCIASDRTFTVTNGPIGTPWFTPVNIAAARVYAKVLDPQPDGLVASPNPYVEIRTTRPVTMANR